MTASPFTTGALGIVIGTAEQRRIAAALTRLGWQAGWENAAATLGRHPTAHERERKVPSAREVPATQALCASSEGIEGIPWKGSSTCWLARDSTTYGKMPSVPSGWRPAELPNDGSVPLVAKGSLGAERAPVLPEQLGALRCAR